VTCGLKPLSLFPPALLVETRSIPGRHPHLRVARRGGKLLHTGDEQPPYALLAASWVGDRSQDHSARNDRRIAGIDSRLDLADP
jgi:hypothetical protein